MVDGNSPRVENNMNETVHLLPNTDDEDDRTTTISSRSSLSTSTSDAQPAKKRNLNNYEGLEQGN